MTQRPISKYQRIGGAVVVERRPDGARKLRGGTGRRQASCRINGFIYAASFMMFCGLKCFSPLVSISSGFR